MLRNRDDVPAALRRPEPPAPIRLALNVSDAAAALSISEPTLRGLVDLPRVRLGTRTLYPLTALQAWLDERATRPADDTSPNANGTDAPTSIPS